MIARTPVTEIGRPNIRRVDMSMPTHIADKTFHTAGHTKYMDTEQLLPSPYAIHMLELCQQSQSHLESHRRWNLTNTQSHQWNLLGVINIKACELHLSIFRCSTNGTIVF
ncbi:uncharacterized protein LOC117123807 [Anneissia japonica]|uniref:uncharacterized protein LOC117123807 n=1 Tax=Anneissia japonica TaxID=1529436 RepID=UPI001425984B|nr:uncharacterized protein LOC117123807 [Anneissia japonica]